MTAIREPSTPEVSVLMSCYNGLRWVGEAIESVLAQTYAGFEFVIVDDGSKDNTLEIIRGYAARDKRIVVLAKQNTGLADSLNSGLALAKGGWIARVDQDDLCGPARLERQLAYARAHPGLALLGSGFAEINESGAVVKEHSYPPAHRALVGRLERVRGFFPHSSAFYLAAAAKRAGGYNPRITRAEDWRLWLALSLQGEVACLPEPLVKIRKHAGQMSLDGNGARQFCDGVAAVACHFLCKGGHPDPSADPDKEAWAAFSAWVDREVAGDRALERLAAWGRARHAYFAAGNAVSGALRSAAALLGSGCAAGLLRDKLCGTGLPQKLAAAWIARGGNSGEREK